MAFPFALLIRRKKPLVTLTGEELQEIKYQMQTGEVPPDTLKKYYAEEAKAVFGHDARWNRKGQYIEQGLGSAFGQTRNSIEAYKKEQFRRAGGPEPGYEETLKRMEAELVTANERRKAEKEAQGDDV